MRYVAAYLLAVLGGKQSPGQNDIEKILSSVGIEIDAEKLKKVIAEFGGKNVDDLIAQGNLFIYNSVPRFLTLKFCFYQEICIDIIFK